MDDDYNLVASQNEQRKRHRGLSKQSPFNYQDNSCKEILKESHEFSKERNPLSVDPKNSLNKTMTSPAGMISGFGRKMLEIESKSPVDLSRKAKFITSIALGDPKMN